MGKNNKYNNYSKMSTEAKQAEVENVIDKNEESNVSDDVVDKAVLVYGIVSGCKKLNIRKSKSTDSKVVRIVDVNTELAIDTNESDNKWFSVTAADGLKGYCMKAFVTLKQ